MMLGEYGAICNFGMDYRILWGVLWGFFLTISLSDVTAVKACQWCSRPPTAAPSCA
mgnify:CR=1 FL=1